MKDIALGNTIGPTRIRRITTLLAGLIVITPYCVAAIGVAIILFNTDSLPAIVIGLIIVAMGYYLRSPRKRNTANTLRRPDAPRLFALLDEISKQLNAPEINGVHVTRDFNAYMAEFGQKERILGIGAPLWLSLEPTERVAVLAHEVGHLINQDPARTHLNSGALGTLARWHDLSHPPAIVDHETNTSFYVEERGIVGQVFGFLFGAAIETLAKGFEKLIFADSQRAEYLADVASASVAGVAAENASLKKVILAPLAENALGSIRFDGSKDIPVFEEMARAVREPDADDAANLFQEATQSTHTVDSSHPPTRYRMEVVAAAGSEHPSLNADMVDWAEIAQELEQFFEREKQKLLSDIIVQ